MTNQSDSHLNQSFEALADPSRRAIVALLRDQPQAVGSLADALPISRPAVSQHLKVLQEARIVDVTPQGTRRIYRLSPDGLTDLRAWLDTLWIDALAAYAAAAQEET